MRIRRDEKGLYIRSRCFSLGDTNHYRPGGGPGLVRIRLEDGRFLHWARESVHRLRDPGPEP